MGRIKIGVGRSGVGSYSGGVGVGRTGRRPLKSGDRLPGLSGVSAGDWAGSQPGQKVS